MPTERILHYRRARARPEDGGYWTETLGVSEQTLRDAVAEVGSSAEKVREAVGQAR